MIDASVVMMVLCTCGSIFAFGMAVRVFFIGSRNRSKASGTGYAITWHPPCVKFDAITSDRRTFKLAHEMRVPVSIDEGMAVLESDILPILAYGATVEDAAREFQDHFSYLWDSITQQDDNILTSDAQRTKRKQLELVSTLTIAA